MLKCSEWVNTFVVFLGRSTTNPLADSLSLAKWKPSSTEVPRKNRFSWALGAERSSSWDLNPYLGYDDIVQLGAPK